MIVIVGLDNTVCDSRHRSSIAETDGWEAYHARLGEDRPHEVMVKMICLLDSGGHAVFAVTSRPERWRSATVAWLVRHRVPIERVFMRGDDDYRPACEVKADIARRIMKVMDADKIDMVIDDRDDVIAAFRGQDLSPCCLRFAR